MQNLLARIILSVFFVIFGAGISPVQAQEDSLRAHSLRGVEVKAARIPSALRSGSPVQSMTRGQMEELGVTELSEALRHFAGVQVMDYGGVGGLKTVNIRGLGAQHTGVSYDGVQIGDCQSGQVDISRFTLDQVSLLYLTIGQSDDIYESARQYASAGTLNILTESSDRFDPVHPLSGMAMVKTGSYGLIQPSFLFSDVLNPRLRLSAFLSGQHVDGNYRFHLMNGTSAINEKRNNSDVDAWRGEVNLTWLMSPRQDLHAKVYLFDSRRGLPGGVIYDNPYSAERLADKNFFVQVRYEHRFSDRLKMKAAGEWNYSWMRDSDVPASGPTEDRFRQNETYFTATGWYRLTHLVSLSLAQDFSHNYLSTTLHNCPYPSRNCSQTAAAMKYEFSRLTATVSCLYTGIHESVKSGVASPDLHRWSPAFSLAWQPFPETLRFRLSYKDIFRTPTLNDRYYLLIGNTSLKPEKTRQWNVGFTWTRHLTSFLDRLTLTADGYYGRVIDKIVAVPTMLIWKMTNLGKVRSLGTYVTLNARLAWTKKWYSDLMVTYDYLHAVDKTTPGGATYDNQIAYTPRNAGSASMTLHSPWLDLAYNLYLTGTRYTMNYNGPENHLPSIVDHSVSLSRSFAVARNTLRLQLDLLNLGGKNYEVIRFYPMPGRNFRMLAEWKF